MMEARAEEGPSQTQGIDTSPATLRREGESAVTPSLLWGKLISKKPGDSSAYDLGQTDDGTTKHCYVLGRHVSCDIRVRDNRVSKEHCRIFASYAQGRLKVFIEDCSANGTTVNETLRLSRGERMELSSGDSVNLCADRSVACFIFINLSEQLASLRAVSLFSHLERAGPGSAAKYSRRIEDDYVIGDLLGCGQSGRVHLCVHKVSRERFAVKVIDTKRFALTPGLTADEIKSEARILSSLDHPRIIKIFDTYESEGVLFIVMELVLGGDLFERVSGKGRYSEEAARLVMRGVLSAVSYLHGRDIVHRDLKPENILLVSKTSDTEVKITDFGLAKKANQEGLKTFCGTPQYFAPEVLRRRNTVFGAGRYGSAADMWSVGVTLYILLSGTYPFSEVNLYSQLSQAEYSFKGPEWKGVSEEAKHLVARLMELRPERRLSAEAALKHPWITGDLPCSSTALIRGNNEFIDKADADMYSRPLVTQLSWSRPSWLADPCHVGERGKLSTVGPELLTGLDLMQIYPPRYKSAASAKKEMSKARELPGDEISEFTSPMKQPSVSTKRTRSKDGDNRTDGSSKSKRIKADSVGVSVGTKDAESSKENHVKRETGEPTKDKAPIRGGGKRSHQMNILDAFRGIRK